MNGVNTRIKKGQVLNPKGRGPTPLTAVNGERITGQCLKELIIKHFGMNSEAIANVLTDPNANALCKIIAKTITMAYEEGHIDKAEYLFRRAYGAVPQQVKTTITTKGLTPEQKLEAGRRALAFLEAKQIEETKTIEAEVMPNE